MTVACENLYKKFEDLNKLINIYDLNGECYIPDSRVESDELGESLVGNEFKTYKKHTKLSDYTPWIKKNPVSS